MHGQILQRAFSLERTVDNVTELNLSYFFVSIDKLVGAASSF